MSPSASPFLGFHLRGSWTEQKQNSERDWGQESGKVNQGWIMR
jgi:hypothetical protein